MESYINWVAVDGDIRIGFSRDVETETGEKGEAIVFDMPMKGQEGRVGRASFAIRFEVFAEIFGKMLNQWRCPGCRLREEEEHHIRKRQLRRTYWGARILDYIEGGR